MAQASKCKDELVDAFKICKRSVNDGCVEGVVPKTGDIGEGGEEGWTVLV